MGNRISRFTKTKRPDHRASPPRKPASAQWKDTRSAKQGHINPLSSSKPLLSSFVTKPVVRPVIVTVQAHPRLLVKLSSLSPSCQLLDASRSSMRVLPCSLTAWILSSQACPEGRNSQRYPCHPSIYTMATASAESFTNLSLPVSHLRSTCLHSIQPLLPQDLCLPPPVSLRLGNGSPPVRWPLL